MKKCISAVLALGLVLALAPAANAALIAEDGFNYPAGAIATESGQGWQAVSRGGLNCTTCGRVKLYHSEVSLYTR